MRNTFKTLALAGAMSVTGALAASAATVTIELTQYDSVAEAVAAQNAFIMGDLIAYEDFEGFCSYEMAMAEDCDAVDTAGFATEFGLGSTGPLETALGKMRSLPPGDDPGTTAVVPYTDAIVRSATEDDTMGGRYDADTDTLAYADNNNYLDSNDTGGIRLNIPGAGGSVSMFDQLSFLLMDIDDVGALAFELIAVAKGDLIETVVKMTGATERLDNATIWLASFSFSELVDDIRIDMSIDVGDGFGVDSMAISAVPLPAGGVLLLSALGGLALARRRKSA